MSAVLEATRPAAKTKKSSKGARATPHHTEKTKKWYPTDDIVQPRKVGILAPFIWRDVEESVG